MYLRFNENGQQISFSEQLDGLEDLGYLQAPENFDPKSQVCRLESGQIKILTAQEKSDLELVTKDQIEKERAHLKAKAIRDQIKNGKSSVTVFVSTRNEDVQFSFDDASERDTFVKVMDGILEHNEDTGETIPLEWHPNKIKTIITKSEYIEIKWLLIQAGQAIHKAYVADS